MHHAADILLTLFVIFVAAQIGAEIAQRIKLPGVVFATGKADLVNIMSTFKTPFNVLVGSTLVVTMGTPVPAGKLDAVVHIKAHAGL